MNGPSASARARILRFDRFEVNLETGELLKEGARLKLQEQPFQLLAMLLERPGELVTREQLREKLWPADTFVDFDHSLNTAINKLRETLGDSPSGPRFIETLPRRGYRFIFTLENPASPAAPGTLPSEAEALPPVPRGLARTLFILVQIMYLGFYVAALNKLPRIAEIVTAALGRGGLTAIILVMVTAMVGIPLRLFLFFAVSFDFGQLGEKYRRLFPVLLGMDFLWALAPLLMVQRIGVGLAFAVMAALLYLSYGQRTLVRMAYRG